MGKELQNKTGMNKPKPKTITQEITDLGLKTITLKLCCHSLSMNSPLLAEQFQGPPTSVPQDMTADLCGTTFSSFDSQPRSSVRADC